MRTVPIVDEEFLSDLKHWIGKNTEGLVFGSFGQPLSVMAINYIEPTTFGSGGQRSIL